MNFAGKGLSITLSLAALLAMTPLIATAKDPLLLNAANATSTVLKGAVKIESSSDAGRLAPLQDREQVVIDNEVRTIGGTAEDYRASRSTPSRKFQFVVPAGSARQETTLVLGYIRGINTPEAHLAGQSEANHVSSPATIKVNGVAVGSIYYNDELVKVRVPKHVLKRGFNTVQIDAGYYFMPGNLLAYDQIELQHLALLLN